MPEKQSRKRTKGCSVQGKSIPRDKLENQFEEMLQNLTPTAGTFELAKLMFDEAWEHRRSDNQAEVSRHKSRQRQIEKEVRSLVDRAARTQHDETARAYESRVAELRSETALLEENLASQHIPEKNSVKCSNL
ncbi:hypothetical protein [Sulfitobacter sp.]|uniref:hypothetical protein n=1 Tax=Sulfitobacter sp. TaxID=1903071 RepID=UPI0030033421